MRTVGRNGFWFGSGDRLLTIGIVGKVPFLRRIITIGSRRTCTGSSSSFARDRSRTSFAVRSCRGNIIPRGSALPCTVLDAGLELVRECWLGVNVGINRGTTARTLLGGLDGRFGPCPSVFGFVVISGFRVEIIIVGVG